MERKSCRACRSQLASLGLAVLLLLVHCAALARSVRAHCAVVVSDKHLMVEEKDRDSSVPVFVLLFKERERPPPPPHSLGQVEVISRCITVSFGRQRMTNWHGIFSLSPH